MKKLIKWETIILMFLVILLLFYTIGINSKHKRYIDEDKEQFISKIDSLIDKSKDKIDSIISNSDEVYVKDEDIHTLKGIYELYIEIRKDINKVI